MHLHMYGLRYFSLTRQEKRHHAKNCDAQFIVNLRASIDNSTCQEQEQDHQYLTSEYYDTYKMQKKNVE